MRNLKIVIGVLSCCVILLLSFVQTVSATEVEKKDEKIEEKFSVAYNSHVQDLGWEKEFSKIDGQESGTTGKNLKNEAIKIKLVDAPKNVNIEYQVYVKDIGWQEWKKNGEEAGTTGKNKIMEAIKIRLTGTENYSVEYTAQKLKELCVRAGAYTIGVEPMPYSGLPDVKKAWQVVKASGCDNAKLILDSWHWIRAGQSYDPSVLADVPADKVVSIQINDVQAHPYAASILRDESMHDRMIPGTGHGDTAGFVKMIVDKGIDPKVVGVEVISDEILSHGVAEAAKENYEATSAVLKKVWPEVLQA